jgi:5-methylcytosine-specific restriction protein A
VSIVPRKPKRPCAYGGCPNLTDGYYCADHTKTVAKQYNQFKRDPATNKRYGTQWRKIRTRYIAANPLCEICKESGRLTAADTIHHKRKLTDGGTNDRENLQALCHSCHSRIHMTENNQSNQT